MVVMTPARSRRTNSTATVPVNPEGEIPLTRAQAWKGLVLKARDGDQHCTFIDTLGMSWFGLGITGSDSR